MGLAVEVGGLGESVTRGAAQAISDRRDLKQTQQQQHWSEGGQLAIITLHRSSPHMMMAR